MWFTIVLWILTGILVIVIGGGCAAGVYFSYRDQRENRKARSSYVRDGRPRTW